MKTAVRGLFQLLALAFVGCSSSPSSPQDEVRRLGQADSFELFSLEPYLDPDTHEMDLDPNGPGERLYGWRILGKTTVSDEATRRELVATLKKGLEQGGGGDKCFNPRHAIRRMEGGKPVDLLVCFECGNIELRWDGKPVGKYYTDIARDGQSVFDEALKKADVPLAKKAKR
jgi:hypothetical protein